MIEEDFLRMLNVNTRGELRDLKIKLQDIEAKANSIIGELEPFSIHQFETRFFRPRENRNSAIMYMQREVELAKKEERISSMKMAECALNSISEFMRHAHLSFNDITLDWLKSYERHMIKKGNSPSTVGMYLRGLRVAFNKAIKDGLVAPDQYPFGKV